MKKLSISVLLIIFIICTISAQNEDTPDSMKPALRKNSIYIETLVILPALNYDRFAHKR